MIALQRIKIYKRQIYIFSVKYQILNSKDKFMQIIKTSILMIVLMLLFMIIGYAIGGQGGMVIAFLIACATNFLVIFLVIR